MKKALALTFLTASVALFADAPPPLVSPAHNISLTEMYRHHEEGKFSSSGYLTKLQYAYIKSEGLNFDVSYAKDFSSTRNDELHIGFQYAFPVSTQFTLLPLLSFESSSYALDEFSYSEKSAFHVGMKTNMAISDKFHVGLKTEIFQQAKNSLHAETQNKRLKESGILGVISKQEKALGYKLALPIFYGFNEKVSLQATPFFARGFDGSMQDCGVELSGNWSF